MKTYKDIYSEAGMCIANVARALQAEENSCTASDVTEISEENVAAARAEIQRVSHDYRTGNPAIFVITYAKYNEGRSLAGMWIDLTAFKDEEELREFCRQLHSDEEDPELMVVDYESFPDDWYSESYDSDLLEKVIEYANVDADDAEMWEAYIEATCNSDATLEEAREHYEGQFDDDEDFARHTYLDVYSYVIPDWLDGHVDWESLASELMNDFSEYNGYYFHD